MNSSSETTPQNGGHQANKSGNLLESFVTNILTQKGYTEFWNHKEQLFANRHSVGGKQFARQVIIGESIYGTKVKADFLVLNKDKFPDGLIIECKWQEKRGSVDLKYPFNVFNIAKLAIPTVILIDGKGYSKKSFAWLKDQAHPEKALTGVHTMVEFQTIVNRGLLD